MLGIHWTLKRDDKFVCQNFYAATSKISMLQLTF